MNQDEYKNAYVLVIKALQQARIHDSGDGYTRLYITRQNGLEVVPFFLLKDIIQALANEHFVTINHFPNFAELIADNKPNYHSPEYEAELRSKNLLDFYPRPVFSMNYFSLTLEDKFIKAADDLGAPLFLLASLSSSKKSNSYRLAELLVHELKVPNSKIAMRMKFKFGTNVYKKRITTKDYFESKKDTHLYNERIENCVRTLRKYFEPLGYFVKCGAECTELIKIQPTNSSKA